MIKLLKIKFQFFYCLKDFICHFFTVSIRYYYEVNKNNGINLNFEIKLYELWIFLKFYRFYFCLICSLSPVSYSLFDLTLNEKGHDPLVFVLILWANYKWKREDKINFFKIIIITFFADLVDFILFY